MSIIPDSIINYIITFIMVETPTALLIREHNNKLCFNCNSVNTIYLMCSNSHINCWKCLTVKMRIEDIKCYGCDFKFYCLLDEIQHVIS
jgi:hypothetical protein